MKNRFILAIIFILTSTLSYSIHAEEKGSGCGVGKLIMEGKEGKGAHIGVALINWLGNLVVPHQLFGMTSGTSGCDVTQQVNNPQQKDVFIAQNKDRLSIDMARGEGAHLESFASLMGVQSDDREHFFSHLQANYQTIISADNMSASIDASLATDSSLTRYVR